MITAAALFFLFLNPTLFAQENGGGGSRELRKAERLYSKGRYSEALDGFMEILVRGEPSEQTIAREYIGRISGDVASGARPSSAPAPSPAGDPPRPRPAPPGLPGRPRDLIKRKLDALKERGVLLAEVGADGRPRALGIPPSLLFSTGSKWKSSGSALIEDLVGLAYALPSSALLIFPRGPGADGPMAAGLLRSQGVRDCLVAGGIAPPRVNANRRTDEIAFPGALKDFNGIVILFIHDRPLNLAGDESASKGGPAISMGLYPESVRAGVDEGAVVEFSVLAPAAGLASWHFDIVAPPGKDGQEGRSLELRGSEPILRQVLWGRRDAGGLPLTPGRHDLVLSATDGRDRRVELRKSLLVTDPDSPGAPTLEAARTCTMNHPPLSSQAAASEAQVKKVCSAISAFYRDHGLRPPGSLADLVPRYLNNLPMTGAPGHAPTNRVRLMDASPAVNILEKSLVDDGGWLFVTNGDTAFAAVDCRHKVSRGGRTGTWFKHSLNICLQLVTPVLMTADKTAAPEGPSSEEGAPPPARPEGSGSKKAAPPTGLCHLLETGAAQAANGEAVDTQKNCRDCEKGDADACAFIGYSYMYGTGFENAGRAKTTAVRFLSRACNMKQGRGCYDLGVAFSEGSGVGKDPGKAMQFYRKACGLGSKEGCQAAQRK